MKAIILCLSLTLAPGFLCAQHKPIVVKHEAQKKALAKFPTGTVLSTELERERGVLVWSMDVKVGKQIQEVWVDAKTGEITNIEEETPAHERKERKEEHTKKKK